MIYIHSTLRPHQQSTLEKIQRSQAKFVILQAPTGSGKSFFPAQLAAWNYKVLACVRTKSLQQQYVNSYNFTELFGKGNYECFEYDTLNENEIYTDDRAEDELQRKLITQTSSIKWFDKNVPEIATADLCTITKKGNQLKALCSNNCPYSLARWRFLSCNAGTLNYSKFLLDRPVVDDFHPDYLFLDEAHDLSDLVVEFSGITLNWKHKRLLKYATPFFIDTPQPLAIQQGQEYLRNLMNVLIDSKPKHPSDGGNRKDYKYWERLKEKIDITLAALTIEPDKWYVYSNDKHFVCKPLTARFHFQRLFDKADKIILMSATIGKIQYFVQELGIEDYEFIDVPNIWPVPLRPIEDLQAGKMGYKSSNEDWIKHSQIIANRINQCPDNWTGLIHSPSKWLTWDMAKRLRKMTGRPIFVPDEKWGTEKAAQEWLKIEDNGTICISWYFWEGIDAGKDNINIVAKVPFIDFSNPFDKARFLFDAKSGYGRTANKMVQGLGRIRRGHTEHYGNGKVVCLADGNWKRLKNYVNQDVLEAIV